MATLREFLDTHKTDGLATHTSMNGGKYFIGEDDLTRFYDLYTESILDGEKQFITEINTPIGASRVDIDFIYEKGVEKHLHTQDQIQVFYREYLKEMAQFLVFPEVVDVYILQKRKPTYSNKKKLMKSGFHGVIPSIKSHKCVEQRIRRQLLPKMEEFFAGLPLKEAWDKVYDDGVVNRSVVWTMYGSRKPDSVDPNALPYLISYILRWDGNDFQSLPAPTLTPDLVRLLSMRAHEDEQIPFTTEGKQLYDSIQQGTEPRSVSRGRPTQRVERPGSRTSSPTARITQPLDPDKREYLRRHVMNLKLSRAEEYEAWVEVGICLHNIHADLLDVFLDFSSQIREKYNEPQCIQKWNGFTYRNDGERLGEGTLRFWSREDNFDGYGDIENTHLDRLIKNACSLTEFDVASVIHAKFRDNYKCSDFRNNVWYRWSGHVWRETDSGVDLLLRLSKEVAGVFRKKSIDIAKDMIESNLNDCLSPVDKKDCGKCEYCVQYSEQMGYHKVYTKLKMHAYKSTLMKECRELFYDEQFNSKLDGNKELIAFNNGVFDMETMEFRDGKPDDYISYSTQIDFDPDRRYSEYPEWSRVELFLTQVLPDAEVRVYNHRWLASCLRGGNPAQKFQIWTGSGSNGKSMMQNLMTRAMGDYACTVPISLLTQGRKGSGNAAPEVARLKGRRFVTMQEPDEAIAFNTGLMKELTSGEKMFARDLFKSGSEFEIQAKFHLSCNDKPKINTTDEGTWRRFDVTNFTSRFIWNPVEPNEFPRDESIQVAVLSVGWATAFMAYLVHILKTSPDMRKLVAPAKIQAYTGEYRDENDAIAKFMRERLAAEKPDTPVLKPELRGAFKRWKEENEMRGLVSSEMERRVEKIFGVYPRGGWVSFSIR